MARLSKQGDGAVSRGSKTNRDTIKDVKELAKWLEDGCTPAKDLLVGVENEKIVFNTNTLEAAEYDGDKGLRRLLEMLRDSYGWKSVEEAGRLIGLEKNNSSLSLEPAGQFELGGAPLKNVHENAAELRRHLEEVHNVVGPIDLAMMGIGFHPVQSREDLPCVPKSRYENFADLFQSKNFLSAMDMMTSTCTCQVNLGFTSEEDMVKKLRVGLALQPIAVALFANSPFANGKPTGYLSYRSHVIQNNVDGRYGFMLPVAFEEDFGFERYADYALNEMPLLGVYQDEIFVGALGSHFKDFMEGKLDICPGQKATMQDWENHLNCIWPEVRLRRFLEMRGADCGPEEMINALPAFWVGLLYDDHALDQAYEMIKDWTEEDREYLRSMTPMQALQTPFLGTTVQEIAKNVLALSDAGLKNRNIKNEKGQDERIYLEPLHEIAQSGRTLAQRLLEKYENEWNRDITKIFDEYRMDKKSKIFVPSNYKTNEKPPNNDNKASETRQIKSSSANKLDLKK